MSKYRRTRVTQKKVFGAQFGTRTAFFQDYHDATQSYDDDTNAVGGVAYAYAEPPVEGVSPGDTLSMTQYHPMVYDLSHPFAAIKPEYMSKRDESASRKQQLEPLFPASDSSFVPFITRTGFKYKGRADFNLATDEPSDLMAQRQMRKIYMKRSKIDIDIHGAGAITENPSRTNPLHFMVVQSLTSQSDAEAGNIGGDLQTFIIGRLGGMKTKAQNNFKLLNHKVFNQAMTTNNNACKYQYSWKPVDWNRSAYNAADADPDDLVPVQAARYCRDTKHRYLVIFFETGKLMTPDSTATDGVAERKDGTLLNNGFIEMKVTKTVKYTPATDVTMDDTDPYGIAGMVKSLVQKQMKMTEETQV